MQAEGPAVQRCTAIPDRRGCRPGPAHQRGTNIPSQLGRPGGRVTLTDGCNATSPEIRARSFAHSRGAGQVVICDRLWWIWSAGLGLPIARIGARHFYRPPRREATRSRHVTSRPAGAQRRRADSPASITEAVPRGRVTRGFTPVADHGPSMQARGLRYQRCTTIPGSTRVQGGALRYEACNNVAARAGVQLRSRPPAGATQRHLRFARVRSLTLAARGRS